MHPGPMDGDRSFACHAGTHVPACYRYVRRPISGSSGPAVRHSPEPEYQRCVIHQSRSSRRRFSAASLTVQRWCDSSLGSSSQGPSRHLCVLPAMDFCNDYCEGVLPPPLPRPLPLPLPLSLPCSSPSVPCGAHRIPQLRDSTRSSGGRAALRVVPSDVSPERDPVDRLLEARLEALGDHHVVGPQRRLPEKIKPGAQRLFRNSSG